MEISEKRPSSLLESFGALLAKTAYGHAMEEVLTLALLLEDAIDRVAVSALSRSSTWERRVFVEDIWTSVRQDEKVRIVGQILEKAGADSTSTHETVRAIRELQGLRNTMAHSILGQPGTKTGGLNFEGYRRGKQTVREISSDRWAGTLCEGKEALVALHLHIDAVAQ